MSAAHFARTQLELYGERGAAWLAALPTLLTDCAQRWSLTLHPPFEPLTYNYVAPATRADGVEVVLKVGVPNPELLNEIAALEFYNGHGAVRLLESDPANGAFLLEHLRPGAPLRTLDDDAQATRLAAQVMQRLWQPAPAANAPHSTHTFPTVAQWAAGLQRLRQQFDGGTGPLPQRLVAMAEALFADLLASAATPVVLHGDLHHWNILRAEREPWLAIDPKGIIGEPAYEVGALLRNPAPANAPHSTPASVQARRVAILAETLGLDRQRLLGWGLAQAVLSAWWSLEDHGHGWEDAIACADTLATLM